MVAPTDSSARVRLRMALSGTVQGVGFRPFVYRLAHELGLNGWVLNDLGGVVLEVEGVPDAVDAFSSRVQDEAPACSVLDRVTAALDVPLGYSGFRIVASRSEGTSRLSLLPDLAICEACRTDVLDAANRRHGYPFTNCTECGPRFSIVTVLPYDRGNTSMAGFAMCPECQREYDDPTDRRFHAQPNACPVCGPGLELWEPDGTSVAKGNAALEGAADLVRRGQVLAVKGLGGFHLVVDATDEDAVARLRTRKKRFEKPLALMVASLDGIRALCFVSREAEVALLSRVAPIVLLPRRPDAPVASTVAAGNPRLGVMLPYTPLHVLLLKRLTGPVVATSGNLREEPICIDERDALERLHGIADAFLVHDRPIVRHVDDSVITFHGTRPTTLRRARGLAPLALPLPSGGPPVLAVGAHLKNVVALAEEGRAHLSQHLGDMETPRTLDTFERVISDLVDLHGVHPEVVAHDLHPDYAGTRWAKAAVSGGAEGWRGGLLAGARLVAVQHHHAHLASCLLDAGCGQPSLAATWDGTGYGGDGTVWGGEFLLGDARSAVRVATLRPFRLPGGEAAVREPRRVALALLHALWGDDLWSRDDLPPLAHTPQGERPVLDRMCVTGLNSPWSTSMGRLFDGIASLVGLRHGVSFEGQAAMDLEFVADPTVSDRYPLPLRARDPGVYVVHAPDPPPVPDAPGILELDWRPLVEAVVADVLAGVPPGVVSARFHNALADGVARVVTAWEAPRVALTGGCFQNSLLVSRTEDDLERLGVDVLVHRHVPPNDGGISLGQVAVARAAVSGCGG